MNLDMHRIIAGLVLILKFSMIKLGNSMQFPNERKKEIKEEEKQRNTMMKKKKIKFSLKRNKGEKRLLPYFHLVILLVN